jgi:hypothetical protein
MHRQGHSRAASLIGMVKRYRATHHSRLSNITTPELNVKRVTTPSKPRAISETRANGERTSKEEVPTRQHRFSFDFWLRSQGSPSACDLCMGMVRNEKLYALVAYMPLIGHHICRCVHNRSLNGYLKQTRPLQTYLRELG